MRIVLIRAIVPVFAAAFALAGANSICFGEPMAQDRDPAGPPTAELAKKCRALAIKAHPTQPAGRKSGSEQAQRNYFRDCLAKGGNMPE